MRTVGTLMGACLCTALLAAPAHGQQLGIYLSASWDSSTGDTYAYAQTASDYATGYWYFLCAGLTAWGQEQDETSASDEYEGPFGCDSTDAEVDWSFTTYATTNYLGVFSQHYEYIEYETYQADPYCGFDDFDCDSYWDDFELSLVGAYGDYSGPQFWYLPGPPAVTYEEEMLMQELLQEFGTPCLYPTGEYSEYLGKLTSTDGDYSTYYASKFNGHLTPTADYSGRKVTESVTWVSNTCTTQLAFGPGFPPASGDIIGSSFWFVGASGLGASVYGFDEVGAKQPLVDFYQSHNITCNLETVIQTLTISACAIGGSPFPYNGSGNTLKIDLTPSSLTSTRGKLANGSAASGPAQ